LLIFLLTYSRFHLLLFFIFRHRTYKLNEEIGYLLQNFTSFLSLFFINVHMNEEIGYLLQKLRQLTKIS